MSRQHKRKIYMQMEIKLREAAITEAISDYMKKTGILSPLTDISYSIERKNNAGLTAMVELGGPDGSALELPLAGDNSKPTVTPSEVSPTVGVVSAFSD